MISKELVLGLAQERIDELNKSIFIVDLNISSCNNIRLEIDAEDGFVTIEDCVSVSRNIEHNLNRELEDFELSVSSAGIDKPLRHIKQYPKNIGRSLSIKTKSGEKLEGVLSSVTSSAIDIETEELVIPEGKKKKEKVKRTHKLSFDQILEAKVVVSFK
jgi:ribosome maturation factor RimP